MSRECVYTTDGRVKHYSQDEEINVKLGRILGEKFIKYRKRWDAANRFELVTEFPLFMQLDMNQNCNLKCRHCLKRTPDVLSRFYSEKPLSWEDYKRIIDEGQEYNCPSISPCGINEPLLMKDLEKYLGYARDHGFIDIIINTNGTLLTKERAKSLLDSGITRMRFSIDAVSPEIYTKIRYGGNYYEVIKNIEQFLDLRDKSGYQLPIIGVNFCKMSINEHEAEDFIAFWEDKIDIVTTQTFIPLLLEEDSSDYYPSDQIKTRARLRDFKCPQPFQRVVLRNHNITPCCTFSPKLKMGDLARDSIYSVWNSKAMNHLREIHKEGKYFKSDICKKCINLFYPRQKRNTKGHDGIRKETI